MLTGDSWLVLAEVGTDGFANTSHGNSKSVPLAISTKILKRRFEEALTWDARVAIAIHESVREQPE